MTQLNNIAVGVTTRNRPDIFRAWWKMFHDNTPHEVKLYIYEDCSDIPYTMYNHAPNKGVAGAKNELLKEIYANSGCEHVFLFDDDTMPRCSEWWLPFTESYIGHLNYMPNLQGHLTLEPLQGYDNIMICSMLWGSMIYLNRKLLSRDYLMDERYNPYGYEHCAFSRAIFKAKDIPHINLTVKDVEKYIYSFDYDYKWLPEKVKPYPDWHGEYKGLMDSPEHQKMAEKHFHELYAPEN